MPWQIAYFATFQDLAVKYGDGQWLTTDLPIGTLYPDPDYLEYKPNGRPIVSPEYFRDWASSRPPLVIELPCGHYCLDSVTMADGVPGDHGWTVTGLAPLITVSPSINVKNGWHGFVTNGVISDDVEGRTFPVRRVEPHSAPA